MVRARSEWGQRLTLVLLEQGISDDRWPYNARGGPACTGSEAFAGEVAPFVRDGSVWRHRQAIIRAALTANVLLVEVREFTRACMQMTNYLPGTGCLGRSSIVCFVGPRRLNAEE
jgi:hypothetical protein